MENKLSICIPTYNRDYCLGACLRSIYSDIVANNFNAIEVIVSDNGSSDNTQEILKEYSSANKNFKFFCNGKNLGFDRNLLNAVGHATGEYVLLLSDDDEIYPGGLALILEKINNRSIDVFIFGNIGYDKEMKNVISNDNGLREYSFGQYKNLQEFVMNYQFKKPTDLVGLFGGMSGKVFRKSIWDTAEKNEFIGTDAIHLFLIVRFMKRSEFLIDPMPILKTRGNNLRWNSFPAVNTLLKRMTGTAKGYFWICDECDRKYNRIHIWLFFTIDTVRITIFDFAKKYLFTTPEKIHSAKIFFHIK